MRGPQSPASNAGLQITDSSEIGFADVCVTGRGIKCENIRI